MNPKEERKIKWNKEQMEKIKQKWQDDRFKPNQINNHICK